MTLAEYKAREALSLTALAKHLGCPVSTVHGWLTGQRRPDWASLERIRAATDGAVSPADFLPSHSASRETPTAKAMPGFAEAQSPFAAEARALGLDPEAIAEKSLRDAIRAEKERRWREENREAIEAQNAWVEKHGLPLARYRMF
jgi:antitoxin CcdA